MQINEIKAKLNSNEYSFLKTDKRLGNNVILLTAGKEAFFILILGVLFFIPGVHFGNIFGKYNDQMTAIVKPAISESYPNATDFSYCINKGSFTENDIEYKIQYKKTIKNEEKLTISVKKQSGDNKDKQIKTLNIPKATSK